MNLLEYTESSLSEAGLLDGGRILLGCSGGIDSIALLHVLANVVSVDRLDVLTVDHRLQADSGERCAFVTAVCRAMNVRCHTAEAELERIRMGEGIEAGAREERYRLLFEHGAAIKADVIITAHTANDQAETLLMRLSMGSGLRGLSGIPQRREGIFRPWLSVTRQDVEAWVFTHGIKWVEDKSNRSNQFLRNRVRSDLMQPAQLIWGRSWAINASLSASHLRQSNELLAELMQPHIREWLTFDTHRVAVTRSGFASLSRNLQWHLVLHALRHLEGGHRHQSSMAARVKTILEAINSRPQGWNADIGGGQRVVVESKRVWLGLPTVLQAPEALEIVADGDHIWHGLRFRINRGGQMDPNGSFWLSDDLSFPWTVRTAKAGERFWRRGAPGPKKIRRLWMDAGVPRADRAGMAVLEAGGQLVWAQCLGPSHSLGMNHASGRLVRITPVVDAQSAD